MVRSIECASATEEVAAEIVARAVDIPVHVGALVDPGDMLVLLESMKMEIPVLAERTGIVGEIRVAEGDVVRAGDILVVLVPIGIGAGSDAPG